MESYFFIPGNKLNKIEKVRGLDISFLIVDFEDSVLSAQRDDIFTSLQEIPDYKELYYRIPLRNRFAEPLSFEFLEKFVGAGICRFVIPKLKNAGEYLQLQSYLQGRSCELILLAEHPRFLIDLEIVLREAEAGGMINGIALGSHDLSVEAGFEYTPDNLLHLRASMLLLSKAFGLQAIDIASMELNDRGLFDQEVNSGLSMGYTAKFLIHPKQFEWLSHNTVSSDRDYQWAIRIIDALPQGVIGAEAEPFVLDGKVVEKPHIEKAIKIIKAYGK